jgi:hypothetical protein
MELPTSGQCHLTKEEHPAAGGIPAAGCCADQRRAGFAGRAGRLGLAVLPYAQQMQRGPQSRKCRNVRVTRVLHKLEYRATARRTHV